MSWGYRDKFTPPEDTDERRDQVAEDLTEGPADHGDQAPEDTDHDGPTTPADELTDLLGEDQAEVTE